MTDMAETYRPFLTDREPDFDLSFTLDSNLTPAQARRILRASRAHQNGSRYYTVPDLIDCRLDWDRRALAVRTQKALFHRDADYRLMSYLLRGVYAGVLKKYRQAAVKYHIVHGCGVVSGERFYLFTGVSGSGKSTVAKLAGHRTVLNDEAVLLSTRGGRFQITGSPLTGEVPRTSARKGDLAAIFFLEHAPEVRLTPLSTTKAYPQLLCQFFDLAPLFEQSDRKTFQERAEISARLAQAVPCYTLGFKPDTTFWEVIEHAQ